MTHCRCCDMPLFHPISIRPVLCTNCFMKMNARLKKLEAWAKLDGSHVKEGAISK